MRIVIFTHPAFMASQSMPRFARQLQRAYTARGHEVTLWTPRAHLRRWIDRGPLAKWAGYVDQYLLFPLWVRLAVAREPADTLFVMADQALGPWVPRVKHRPLVVHVHDLLALRSALGEMPENPTGFTGRLYQRYIRQGFSQARHFICISGRTRDELQRLGQVRPHTLEVVHNDLNQRFEPLPPGQASAVLQAAGLPITEAGLLLHVSGNQWYKNVPGVVRLYAHYVRAQVHAEAPPRALWLVGVRPDAAVQAALAEVPPQGQVKLLYGLDHEALQAAYSLAGAFLFPSLAEGFGWPIVEAQACGCPVITTDDAPMNEIGGPEARYLPLLRAGDDPQAWAAHGAQVLQEVLNAADAERRRQGAIAWARGFGEERAIGRYLQIYERVLAQAGAAPTSAPVSHRTTP